jgi:3-oxoadipate enol-lactonase
MVNGMSAPVLLLVHGYPFDHTLWGLVLPFLDQSIRVLAPDLRGFGGRPTGNEEPSLEWLADDLERLLDEQQVSRATVAGMSMGGYVALTFAERHPERLAGLGLISSQAAADTVEGRASRRAMIEKVRAGGPGVAAEAAIPKLFAPENGRRVELRRFAAAGADRAGVAGITWALEAMAR